MSDGLDMFGSNTEPKTQISNDELFGNETVVDINLDKSGNALAKKNNKTLLVDADTIIFTACLNTEIIEDLFPINLYSTEEWLEIQNDPTFDEESWTRRFAFDDDIDNYIKDKLQYMMDQTGTTKYELHLTGNARQSFRYKQVDKMYKANRKGGTTPAGLHDAKIRWVENNPTNVFIWDEWEADDICVVLKRDNPNKYILAAVDKDVLYSLPGKHFNYYTSAKYNIDMKWIEVDKDTAMRHHYIQCLMGDGTDNIIGLSGIGPVKAKKILADCNDPVCMWQALTDAYEDNGRTIIEALNNMRLVDMQQLQLNSKGEYELNLWKPLVGTSYSKG